MSSSCLKKVENFWKLKTKNANKLFNKGSYDEALNNYKDALYRAEVLNGNSTKCQSVGIPYIQVYLISCNNLANTYVELGETKEGASILRRSVYYLLYLAKENMEYIQEIKNELRNAVLNYLDFCKKHKQDSDQEHLITILKNSL